MNAHTQLQRPADTVLANTHTQPLHTWHTYIHAAPRTTVVHPYVRQKLTHITRSKIHVITYTHPPFTCSQALRTYVSLLHAALALRRVQVISSQKELVLERHVVNLQQSMEIKLTYFFILVSLKSIGTMP